MLGAGVFGISRDSLSSHEKFSTKLLLPYPLISDSEGEVCELYGVLKEKKNYGKVSVGIERTTFIIDEEGRIAAIFPKVKVAGHANAVVEKLKEMQ